MDKLVVFLDSNEYKRCGHNFSSTPMRKLQELVCKNVIRLISTTVVNGEVSEHIGEDVETFLSAQKKLARSAGGVQNIPEYCDIIRRIDSDDIKQKAQQAFTRFIDSTQCEILSCNGIDNDALLGDYFAKRPPFEERAKKAAEFKDAFISYTLKRYAAENDIKIQVVSSDEGFCASFHGNDRFRIFGKLEELFSYITWIAEEIPRENAKAIQAYADRDDVHSTIIRMIEDEIFCAGAWVDGAEDDCDVVNVEVKNVCLSYTDDIEEHLITAHFDVVAALTVDYSCIDEDNSYWDKEEGAYLFLATSELRITKELPLSFCITLSVDDSDEGQIKSVCDIEGLHIEEDTRYGIRIEPESDDEIEVLRSSLSDVDDEYVPGAYNTCPDCGRKINFENDGGNGFCIHCAPNH